MGERDGYASKDVSVSVASATARCLDFAARRREWHPPEGMRNRYRRRLRLYLFGYVYSPRCRSDGIGCSFAGVYTLTRDRRVIRAADSRVMKPHLCALFVEDAAAPVMNAAGGYILC